MVSPKFLDLGSFPIYSSHPDFRVSADRERGCVDSQSCWKIRRLRRVLPLRRDAFAQSGAKGERMKVFLSYSRNDAAVAAAAGEDVRQMGHAVWYDREVTGGQSW